MDDSKLKDDGTSESQHKNNAVVMRRFGAYEAKGPVLYYNGQKLHTYESDDEAIKAAERWYKRHIKNGA